MKVLVELITNEHKHIFQKVEEETLANNKKMWEVDDSFVGYLIYVDYLEYAEQKRKIDELKSRLARIQLVAKGEI